jgi:CHAT domain-containing protein
MVKKDELEVVTTSVSRQELAHLAQEFLNAIGASNFDQFRERFATEPQILFKESSQLGARLYNYLVAPIEKYLSSQQIIYFVPDEILYYLPFVALTVPDADQQQFLIEKYKIAYMPSLTVYSYLANRHPNKFNKHSPRMFAIGNPTGDLWNSEQEVKSIAGLFSASEVLIREQATERAVLAGLQSDIDYFHFAGHCRINEKSPMYSALLLCKTQSVESFNYSGDGTDGIVDDGMLTVNDLLNRSLDHIELATLSACETALGKLSKGEGMMGLSQVLLGSGIPTLVSSLWKVDDRNSAELMERFYRYLVAGKDNKLEALRKAQLDKIAWCSQDKLVKYPFPYFWASYILNGAIQ